MKRLLSLSLAALLVSSVVVADVASDKFVHDEEILRWAPRLVHEFQAGGIEIVPPSNVIKDSTGADIPLLNDIVEIISANIFQPASEDWSNLEKARLQAIEKFGDENFKKWASLGEMDARRSAAIVNTIYDTVITIPPVTAEKYQASKEAAKKGNLWDILGISLVKTADVFKKAKGVVIPTAVCETTNTDYLKGVESVVHYSSLTHGLAGGLLVSASSDAAVKSPDLKDLVEAVGKLAIEMQMAQNIARLAGLKPEEDVVRLMTLLGLAAVNSSSLMAHSARDVFALIKHGLESRIPPTVITSLVDQAAIILITKGAGEQGNSLSAEDAPILRNVVAFSSDVLAANNIGETLKYVFCPDSTSDERNASTVEEEEKVGDENKEVKDGDAAKEAPKDTDENIQKVFIVTEDKVADASEALKESTEKVVDKAAEAESEAEAKVADAKDKVADTKEKVADAAAEVKNIINDIKEGAEKVADAVVGDSEDTVEIADEANEAVAGAEKKADEDAHQEL
ncbi:hypothetical protein BGW42_002219 [Actinomortierella wolfii]|nr:hypothetical protein BGW42_002219 [Actinomortierella wolfii]